MKTAALSVILFAAALSMALTAIAAPTAAKQRDPRLCSSGSRIVCVKDASEVALITAMARRTHDPNWGAVITCRAYAGLLRVRCTWRNGRGRGAALVTFTAPAFRPVVTPR